MPKSLVKWFIRFDVFKCGTYWLRERSQLHFLEAQIFSISHCLNLISITVGKVNLCIKFFLLNICLY